MKYAVTIDFETYFSPEYTLSKMTTEAYIRDPRFQTIGVGVDVDGEREWMEHYQFVRFAEAFPWHEAAVLAHHAHFDGLILSHHYGVIPGFWACTLSMGRAIHGVEVGGSLAKLMKHYQVGEKGDEVVKASGKRREDFAPEEWLRYGEYCLNDCYGAKAILRKMLDAGFPDEEFQLIDLTVRMFTEPKLELDEALLTKYLGEEKARKAALIERFGGEREDLMSNARFAQCLIDLGEVPPMKVSKTTGEEAFAFAKSDPGMQELLEHPDEEVRWLAEARVGVKSTINESRTERLLAAGKSGRKVPVYLKYAGAHTQRWSGGDKLNWQNFQRGGTLRDAILAPAGKVLVVVDSAQIEARGSAWLAGDSELVVAFAQGRDVYSEFASKVYGRPIDRKANPEDKEPGYVGKVAVLGLGYQMGWLRFATALAAGPMGAPPVIFTRKTAESMGVEVGFFSGDPRRLAMVESMPSRLDLEARLTHCAVADFIVRRWRRENGPICAVWHRAQGLLEDMCDALAVGSACGPLRVEYHALRRPCGLALKYPGLEARDGDGFAYNGGGGGKQRVRIYGGLLTENIVQALARDVVAHQMLRLSIEFGYEVALMTHDEIVLVVEEAQGEKVLADALTVMRTPPEWAKGWPLNAEGAVAKSYGEAK